ncbi:deacetylase [Sphaerisporangium sp. NPDC051011]|uniref:deacetylase n=1 Tax=Sphaerisporangium sp. NPDC051011 TaxID=3155792 RepID=UPI0033DB60A4
MSDPRPPASAAGTGRSDAGPRRPAFIITIDVEEDDAWSGSATGTTRNAAFLPRFQALCDRYGLPPTYLVDWTMATSPAFQEFGRAVLERGRGELGMHLHAWTTPPILPLTGADHQYKPFLTDYPEHVMAAKVTTATRVLQDTFQIAPVSHRAGRWTLDETYARILIEHGYLADCSVTPHISWRGTSGAPGGRGPRDYTAFPEEPYFVDPGALDRAGGSPLLEVPMTIVPRRYGALAERTRALLSRSGPARRVAGRLWPATTWMRPNGRNRREMIELARRALHSGHDHVEFMLHSSELMPGGSPYFRTFRSVEALYDDIESLFAFAAGAFEGLTLAGYRTRFAANAGRPPESAAGPRRTT